MITFIDSNAVGLESGQGTSLVFVGYTAPSEGTFMLVTMAATGGTARTFTPPDGSWTLIGRQDNGLNPANAVYYKLAGPSEPGTCTFSVDSAVPTVAALWFFGGVNQSNPISDVQGANGVTGTNVTFGTVPTSSNHGLLFKTVAARNTSGAITLLDGGPNSVTYPSSSTFTGTRMMTGLMTDVSIANPGTYTPEDATLDLSCTKATLSFVVNDDTTPSSTIIKNNFEDGTNGTTITTSNAGGTGNTQFDDIYFGPGAAAFDTGIAKSSGVSGKLSTAANSTAYLVYSSSFTTRSSFYGRTYMYISALPSANFHIFQCLQAPSTILCAVGMNTSGQIRSVTSAGTQMSVSSSILPLNQWVRIEFFINLSTTTGQTIIRYYSNPDSLTPTEFLASTATYNIGAYADLYRYGIMASTSFTHSVYYDNVALATGDWIPPILPNTTPISWFSA